MKILSRTGVLRLMAVVVACLTFGYANAANRLYIDDFTINDTEPVRVAVMLDNTDEVAALQFNLLLPQGLTMVGTPERNNERFNPTQNMLFNPNRNNLFMVTSGDRKPFIGNSGAICYFYVQASQWLVNAAKPVSITLNNIVMSTGKGVQLECEKTTSNKIKVQNGCAELSSASQVYINPEGTQRISVSMTNDFVVRGVQIDIVLPQGFTIAGETLNKGTRLSEGSNVALVPHADGFTYGALITDWTGQDAVTGNDGELFWFDIVAPANFEAESAMVTFTKFKCSTPQNVAIEGEGCAVKVMNGLPAYNRAMTEIAALEKALQDALAEIATAAPNVKDQFPGTEISESIATLKAAVNEAYTDLTLTDNYDTVMAPAAGIKDATAKLIEDAKAAQAEYEAEVARQEAFTNANAEIAKLEAALQTALTEIATAAPDVKDNFKGEEITAQIEGLKKAVNEAYENKTIVEKYDELMAPVPAINSAITKLVEDAKAAQADFEALENINAEIAKLEAALQTALTEIATAAPDVKDYYKGEEITAQIEALKDDVDEAYEHKTIVADYDTLMASVTAINEAIAKLVEDAKAAQADYEAEQARQEAFAKANAEIAKLEAALQTALTEIATVAPDVKNDFRGEEITAQIEALKKAVNEAFANKTIVEKYDELMAPVPAINEAIAKLVEDAKAAQAEYEDQLRRAANQAAYEADMEIIEGLQEKLDIAVDMIRMVYPDYDIDTPAKPVQDAIDAEADKAAAALAAVEEEGIYSNTVDAAAIEAMIQKLKDDAKTLGIDEILGDAFGEGARIFTLEGVEVPSLQQGKVNIVVYPNGLTKKVFIK